MLTAPLALLTVTGILPLLPKNLAPETILNKLVSTITASVAVFLFIGTLSLTGFQCASFIYGLFHQEAALSLLKTLRNLPYLIMNARALLVLSIFFYRRQSWANLLQETYVFLKTSLPASSVKKVLKKLGKVSAFLCILTAVLHIVWQVIGWVSFFHIVPNVTSTDNIGFEPLPWKYPRYINWIIDGLFFDLPFILSQQVLICLIVLSFLINQVFNNLIQSIQGEIVAFSHALQQEAGQKLIDELERKVFNWEEGRYRIVLFFGKTNQFFGAILTLLYSLDFVTVLGFLASVAQNDQAVIESYATLLFNAVLFWSYGAIFIWPLILVHEKNETFSFALHQLSCVVEQHWFRPGRRPEVKTDEKHTVPPLLQLVARLRQLERNAQTHGCTFNGIELLYFTRTFLAEAAAFLLSFILVAKEFLGRNS